jgi:hypothetical protein
MRPKIICHMVSSIDERLLMDRWTRPAAGMAADIAHRTYDQIAARFDADGWIVGRKTMESFAEGTARMQSLKQVKARSGTRPSTIRLSFNCGRSAKGCHSRRCLIAGMPLVGNHT